MQTEDEKRVRYVGQPHLSGGDPVYPVMAVQGILALALLLLGSVGSVGCGRSTVNDCEPTTCAAEGRSCGSLGDGCGSILVCGTCSRPNETCNDVAGICACDFEACDGVCCAPSERCVGNQCVEHGGWYGVTLGNVWAPDEHTVVLALSGDPGQSAAELASIYGLGSPLGSLVVQAVSYEAAAQEVTLTTSRQKLGVTYTVTVDRSPYEPNPETADFIAADTAGFWVTDFSDPMFGDYWIVADRVGVGTRSVAYVEQGWDAWETASALAEFDGQVYPTLTGQYIAAPDFDGNERVVLLGLDGEGYYGGYFSPTNQYPDDQTMTQWGRHSNEMEIVHINISYGTWMVREVVTHEFGHLLYHERHGLQAEYWDYHDEGLAEAGVHLVYGVNQGALDYYYQDPQGLIGNGLSLVHWTWAQYENYALAYLWWIYLASRTGDLSGVSGIFNLATGDPAAVDTWIAQNIGGDFASAQRDFLVANWVKAAAGPYGYGSLLDLSAQPDPTTVTAGTTSVDLPPFAGAFFRLGAASVGYPGTEGADIWYLGIDGAGTVDATAPFDVGGGALLVFNASQNSASAATQHSGPDAPAVMPPPPAPAPVPLAWTNPPPVTPDRLQALRAWRQRTLVRLAQEGWPVPAR